MNFESDWRHNIMARQIRLKVNFIYNLGYQILAIVLPLVTAPYISRVLGSHNVGVFSYTQAFANYFFLFAMLGVNNYGNRTIAGVRDRGDELNKTFWEIYAFQFLMGLAVSVIYITYCVWFVKEDVLVTFLQFLYVMSGWFNINWLMFGLEQFRLTTIRNIVIRVGMAAAVFLFVKSRADLPVYTMIIAGGNLLSVLIIWPFALKEVPFRKPSLRGIARHIKPNLILFWPVIAVSLYNIMDKLMLGRMSTKKEGGFYTYAENIVQIPNTLILALDNVMLPRMSNLYATNRRAQAEKLMHTVMMFAMMAAAAMSFGLAGVGPVFAPWFYGSEFTRCGLFIVMLSPVIVFKGWAGALRTQYIIPNKKDKVYLISLTSGALVNLCVNYLLIPKYQGIGAVIGTIAAEFVVAAIQFTMLRKEIALGRYLSNGLSFCLIGAVMYVVVRMLSTVSTSALVTIAVQVCCGAAVFLVLSIFYMVKIIRQPVLVNEALKMLRIRYRF